MVPSTQVAKLSRALPFWMSLALVPITWIAATQGGWTIFLMPLTAWGLFTLLDWITGQYTENADLDTGDDQLFWYRLITLIWFPIQFLTLFGTIWYVTS